MSEWTADSNEALHLRLVRTKEDAAVLLPNERKLTELFHPKFTYPIFGEEEKIYGYRDLVINLALASGSLRQFVSFTQSARLTGTAIDDAEGTLDQYLPSDRLKDATDFETQLEKDALEFRPMGEKIYSYVRRAGSEKAKGKSVDPRDIPIGRKNGITGEKERNINEDDPDAVVYEVYQANWSTPGFLEFHRRMQLFVLLYIEGGSYIHEDEENWQFVILFERRKRKDGTQVYHFVGYSSLYPFYFYPDSTRLRLSQFVIAGPYQNQGHGMQLYNAIYQFVLKSPRYAELTVEDPSEDFEDLRDKADLRMLLGHKEFIREAYGAHVTGANGKPTLTVGRDAKANRELSRAANNEQADVQEKETGRTKASGVAMLGPPTKKKWAERWRTELKLAKRQYDRLIEILILRALDPEDEAAQRAFRLQIKARLKVFNFETLMQLEQEEQFDKLEETFQSVKEGYERVLVMLK